MNKLTKKDIIEVIKNFHQISKLIAKSEIKNQKKF